MAKELVRYALRNFRTRGLGDDIVSQKVTLRRVARMKYYTILYIDIKRRISFDDKIDGFIASRSELCESVEFYFNFFPSMRKMSSEYSMCEEAYILRLDSIYEEFFFFYSDGKGNLVPIQMEGELNAETEEKNKHRFLSNVFITGQAKSGTTHVFDMISNIKGYIALNEMGYLRPGKSRNSISTHMVERVFAVQNFERQNGFFEAVIEKFFADLLVKNTNAYRVAMKMPNLSRDNLKNIKMVFDDVKFIICVRDPLTCFLSTYDHQCAILKNSPDTVDDGSRIIEFLLENKEHLNGINKEIIERMPNEIFYEFVEHWINNSIPSIDLPKSDWMFCFYEDVLDNKRREIEKI